MISTRPTKPTQEGPLTAASLRRLGLASQPFAAVADARLRYSDLALDMPIKTILEHLQSDTWLLVLTGDHGIGKSTQLLRVLSCGADTLLFCAFKARPDATYAIIEQTIRQQWAKSAKLQAASLVDILSHLCLSQRRPVLVVDDADRLKPDVLAALLQLGWNVRRHCGRAPGVILTGKPELNTLLEHSAEGNMPLQSRIHLPLRPLTVEQTEAYLRFRLQAAGAKNSDLFADETIHAIYRESRGYPLQINASANRYLQPELDTAPAEAAVESLIPPEKTQTPAKAKTRRPWIPAAAASLVGVTSMAAMLYTFLPQDLYRLSVDDEDKPQQRLTFLDTSVPTPNPEPRAISPEPVLGVPELIAPIAVQPQPAATPWGMPQTIVMVAPQADASEAAAAAAAATSEPEAEAPEPVAVVTPEPEPVAPEPVAVATPELEPVAPEPVAAVTPEPEPVAPEPVVTVTPVPEPVVPEPVVTVTPPPAPVAPQPVATVTPIPEPVPPPEPLAAATPGPAPATPEPTVTPERVPPPAGGLLGEAWIRQQNPAHFTIQIAASNDRQALREYAQSLSLDSELAWFASMRGNQEWYSLITGQYPSSASAQAGVASLPARVRRNQPWIRSFGSIHQDMNTVR